MQKCPIATTVNLIGNKWKLLILRDTFSGPKRFGNVFKSLERINRKVLSENLNQMEADALLIRIAHQEKPPCVEYKLSELGEEMRPLVYEMEQWDLRYKKMSE